MQRAAHRVEVRVRGPPEAQRISEPTSAVLDVRQPRRQRLFQLPEAR